MNVPYEPGAMDSLCMAERAVKKAIKRYNRCRKSKKPLRKDRGRLLQAIKQVQEATENLTAFMQIAVYIPGLAPETPVINEKAFNRP